MAECRELAAWAQSPGGGPMLASDNFITNRIEFMQATLPARAVDEGAGEKRLSVYIAILRGRTRDAMRFLADEAIRRHDWFPTPKQCLEILADFRQPVTEKEATLRICEDFASDQFERWMTNLTEGQPIGDVPEQWIRIAIERGPLRRLANNVVVSRALYHGPVRPFVPDWT